MSWTNIMHPGIQHWLTLERMNHSRVTISHGSTLRQLALFASALVDSETNESFSCYHFTQFNSETACMFVSAVVDTKTNESPNFSCVTISRGSAQRQLALFASALVDTGTNESFSCYHFTWFNPEIACIIICFSSSWHRNKWITQFFSCYHFTWFSPETTCTVTLCSEGLRHRQSK